MQCACQCICFVFLLENSVKLKLIKVHEIVRVFVYSSRILRCKHWDSWVLSTHAG